jgi:nitroreductase
MDYESFLELVKNRRSIHRVKSDPVPDEYINKIIEAARWAPSGFNLQPWEFVVIKDQKLKEGIVQIIRPGQCFFVHAPGGNLTGPGQPVGLFGGSPICSLPGKKSSGHLP